ncbi:MAG TPA: RraA family protein [Candidatus Limnocylindria bacterium]|nr:RraA family protein [Candidatus Limnocylindria bacterium]
MTPWVSDAQGSFGVMHADIEARVPGTVAAGPAFTVLCYPGSIITVHKALAEAKAGDMLVVAGDGDDRGALLGELMTIACQRIGLAGAVIDGPVRDIDGIRELGFPVWARSVTPRVGTNRRVGRTNVAVACGGVVVQPGDWVFADADGVVVVPAANVESVLAAAEAADAKERKIAERLKAGEATIDILGFRDLVHPTAGSGAEEKR